MLIPMSDRDINRFKVLQDVRERRLRQVDAADILNISPRQVRRLLSQLSQHGAISLYITNLSISYQSLNPHNPPRFFHQSN